MSIQEASRLHPFLLLGAFVILLYFLRVVFLAREGIRHSVRRVAVGALTMIIVQLAAPHFRISPSDSEIAAAALGVLAVVLIPNRSRHIPARNRRKVIQDYVAKGGKFDPTLHEIDHIVPFSKGGSHAEENLRVIDKRKNRKKGAKMPKLKDLW